MHRALGIPVVLVLSVVGLVGCVADDTDAEPGLAPPEVVRIANGQRSAGADSAASEMAAEEPASDSALAADEDMLSSYVPWTIVTDFVVGPDLGELPTRSTGYVYRSDTDVDEATARALAEALGVDSTPQDRPAEYMVEWAFGPEDGSAPSLTIDAYSQHYWWYSAGWDDAERYYEDDLPACTETIDADGNSVVECPEWEPEIPVGVPSAEEAEMRAREIISAAGFEPSLLTFEVYADEWYASVYAMLPLAADLGEQSAASWSFGFGANGVLENAGGTFVGPEAVGPYPLVDLDTAMSRLTDWYLMGTGRAADGVAMPAVEEPATAETPIMTDEAEPPAEESLIDPIPAPEVEPTEVTVILVDVVADLWWVNDVDGNSWMLPAYRFVGDGGGWYTVPAVTDEYMIDEPTFVYEDPSPMPVEPIDDSGTSDVGGAEEDVSPELAVLLAPIDLADVDPYILEALQAIVDGAMSISEEVFADNATLNGFEMRVVERDGEPLMVTEDYRSDRINVVVADGNVVSITGIG